MKANEKSLLFLATESAIKIPFFQRGYVWNRNNWNDLLEDLLDTKKNAFLGSLILKQQTVVSGEPKEVLVIDGQQRLTTLSIMLRALYDSFTSEQQQTCFNLLYPMLFYKKSPLDRQDYVKIAHSRVDAEHFERVIREQLSEEEYASIVVADSEGKTRSADSKILQCYKFYREIFTKMEEAVRADLFGRLLDGNRKILVVIDLDDTEDEQAIFDTINSAGVRLSGADIIKNALFQRALQVYPSDKEVVASYEKYWNAVFSVDEDAVRFWEAQRLTGRLIRDNMELLLHAVAVIKSFFDPELHTLSDIPDLYKKHIASLDSQAQIEGFLGEIATYARLYREKILIFDRTALFRFDDDEQRLFHILNRNDISTFHPYILHLYYQEVQHHSSPKDRLRKLERLIVRRMVARQEVKSYNKMCKDFISNPSALDAKLAEVDDRSVADGLRSIANKDAALILFWIELKRRHDDRKQSVEELKYNYSLEHLMPQKWEEYWRSVAFVDDAGNMLPEDEEAVKHRQRCIYSLGNMTLLNSSLNTSLRNYDFERKITGEGRKKGIRAYADLSITRDDILVPFERGEKIWNERSIAERTRRLTEEFLQIW